MVNDPDVEEEEVGVLIALKDAALKPIKIAASPRARRAYLSTVLFTLTALFLLAVAATAYIVFYFSYIPVRGFKQPIYFHFDAGANPHAIVQLKKGHIVSDQPYDVSVSLYLPRTPANTAAGNFMVNLQLLSPQLDKSEAVVLAHERRPAILTYYSPIMENIHKAIGLPLYISGWRKEEEKIDMPIMEGVQFSRGWRNVPATARIELSNAANMQLYSAIISFKTKLRGLRYLIYNWRFTSFIVFTSIFWGVEITCTALLWLGLTIFLSSRSEPPPKSKPPETAAVKQETDTPAEEPSRIIKREEEETLLEDFPQATEADIEDDEEPDPPVLVGSSRRGIVSDSGLGTSLESSGTGKRDTIRRRSSRLPDGG